MRRVGTLRIDLEFGDRLAHRRGRQLALVVQGFESGDHDAVAVDFEETAQLGAAVAAPEAVGAERDESRRVP